MMDQLHSFAPPTVPEVPVINLTEVAAENIGRRKRWLMNTTAAVMIVGAGLYGYIGNLLNNEVIHKKNDKAVAVSQHIDQVVDQLDDEANNLILWRDISLGAAALELFAAGAAIGRKSK